MGPEIIVIAIAIINNGTLQIDFQETETRRQWRCFAQPSEFFSMLGEAMQKQRNQYMKAYFERMQAAEQSAANDAGDRP